MEQNITKAFLGLLRIGMGLIFLWAFLDKTFGLGFATAPERAWSLGGSPTTGFLKNAVHGPFADFFHNLSGLAIVDWMFMLGLLFIGITLTLGIMVRLGSIAGASLLFLMYLALALPPENHPFIDDHLIYILVMGMLCFGNSGKYFGLSNKWYNTSFVQKHKILA